MRIYIKPLLYSLGIFIFLSFFITLLNYIGIVPGNIVTIFKLLIPIITFFVGGFLLGKKSNEKGWLNGIIIGSILIVIFIILDLLFKININFKTITFYLLFIIISTLGSILGINKRTSK